MEAKVFMPLLWIYSRPEILSSLVLAPFSISSCPVSVKPMQSRPRLTNISKIFLVSFSSASKYFSQSGLKTEFSQWLSDTFVSIVTGTPQSMENRAAFLVRGNVDGRHGSVEKEKKTPPSTRTLVRFASSSFSNVLSASL